MYSITIITTKETEAMTLKERKEGYMRRKGKGKMMQLYLNYEKTENFKTRPQ